MKILTVLGLVQIAAILFLYARLSDIDHRLDQSMTAGQRASVSDDSMESRIPSSSNDVIVYADEDLLRQIIRDELSAHPDSLSGPGTQASPIPASGLVDKDEYKRRREQVAEQLSYYTSVGSISNAEMQKLQVDIARLDPASRKEMLMELNRALNSGRLEGQL